MKKEPYDSNVSHGLVSILDGPKFYIMLVISMALAIGAVILITKHPNVGIIALMIAITVSTIWLSFRKLRDYASDRLDSQEDLLNEEPGREQDEQESQL